MTVKDFIKRLEADLVIWRIHRYIRKLESASYKDKKRLKGARNEEKNQ